MSVDVNVTNHKLRMLKVNVKKSCTSSVGEFYGRIYEEDEKEEAERNKCSVN